jgi:hypothetical protein
MEISRFVGKKRQITCSKLEEKRQITRSKLEEKRQTIGNKLEEKRQITRTLIKMSVE